MRKLLILEEKTTGNFNIYIKVNDRYISLFKKIEHNTSLIISKYEFPIIEDLDFLLNDRYNTYEVETKLFKEYYKKYKTNNLPISFYINKTIILIILGYKMNILFQD